MTDDSLGNNLPPPNFHDMFRIMMQHTMDQLTGKTKREEEQTDKVYHAQMLSGLEKQSSFSSFKRCEAYFNEIWKSDFVKENFPARCLAPVRFERSDSNHTSTTSRLRPHLPEDEARVVMGNRNTWKRYVVLHEIAHLCVDRGVRHGPAFVNAFLKLLENFTGKKTAHEVLKAFKKVGVDHG